MCIKFTKRGLGFENRVTEKQIQVAMPSVKGTSSEVQFSDWFKFDSV